MRLRWKELLVAFVLAVGLWYGVAGSEKVETQVELRVEYRGQPANLKIESGLVSKLTVRLRASRGLLYSATMQNYPFTLDLSQLAKGANTVPIDKDQLPFAVGVEVMDVSPSSLEIIADEAVIKSVPLRAVLDEKVLPKDYEADIRIMPPTVQLRGAASALEGLEEITLDIPMEHYAKAGAINTRMRVKTPKGIDATPSEVNLVISVAEKETHVTVQREVVVTDIPDGLTVAIEPSKVNLTVYLPLSMSEGAAKNESITVSGKIGSNQPGSYIVPLTAHLPDRVGLVKLEPESVAVTLKQGSQGASAPLPEPGQPDNARGVKKETKPRQPARAKKPAQAPKQSKQRPQKAK